MFHDVLDGLARAWAALGRGVARLLAWLLAPFAGAWGWVVHRRWWIKIPIVAALAALIAGYGYFFWQTQRWTGFDIDYFAAYEFGGLNEVEDEAAGARSDDGAALSCGRSAITAVTSDLITFNVDDNAWISSMLLYKTGFFGIEWDRTPFFDNKAAFQRGVNQAIRRTTVELVDTLGRIRGTSQVDQDLQDARGAMQFDESTWYWGSDPFGPKTPTPSYYRAAARHLDAFNARLQDCSAVLDARADNLVQFIDRIANDLGATSAILRERSENYNGGWFDFRADDRFWFAYGQLYGYYGILSGARVDFDDVIAQRQVGPLWDTMIAQFESALRIQPTIVSNGREDGMVMPAHLATMGFYVLRVRSNLVEVRSVLDR